MNEPQAPVVASNSLLDAGMEHIGMRWAVEENDERICICTDENGPWFIADGNGFLPGDESGRSTLQHICDLHNAWLTSNPTGQPRTASVRSVAPGCSEENQ